MEVQSLKGMSKEVRIAILHELGYDSDGVFVLKDKVRHRDPYTNDEVRIDNMLVLPGRSPAVVLDNNPLSLVSYLEDHEDIL